MAALPERAFDRDRDLIELLAFVADARASRHPRAFLHPGGLQWLLRKVGSPGFGVRLWSDGEVLAGFAIDDAGYVIFQAAATSLDAHLDLLRLAEERLRREDGTTIEVSAWDDDPEFVSALRSRGYAASGTEGVELICRVDVGADAPVLPDGFSMRWLEPGLDDAYVELHRAAWSTIRPSAYDRAAHAVVLAMPHFDRALVPIVAAPDGTLAASCITWFDPATRTSEIEPLGTHPGYRRLGLARAVSQEAVRRSARRGATSVQVWGVGADRIAVYRSAGFRRTRVLREYRRGL